MNDEQTIILIESINLNPNLSASEKLDLVRKTMSDCREKQIGKIIVDAIQGVPKKRGPYKKNISMIRGGISNHSDSVTNPVKRGRGRPRKELSDNARNMILHSRDIDRENGIE